MARKHGCGDATPTPASWQLGARPAAMGIAMLVLLLQACALPRTIQVYDPDCQIVAREMVLEVHDMQLLRSCSAGRNCLDQLAVGLAVLATSTVISGSIVIAGNVVYWMERQKNCRLRDRVPVPPALPASPS